ncbi:hypothetical protein [Actinomycetospora cinnamomea]|uniref:Integral membrane protein n=1 Tax=Actinomycetospora cinnamomea TaxID=663609 RepID=A0A2U1F2G3_9PSEU|nr:hypothetical protein [Actinomycetospora cinnamomea]PVZ06367.1 hypothetical protein C8D89_113105 [Actinomycetospora cinnamomea]
MTTTSPAPPRRAATRIVLVLLEGLLGISAVYGAVGLLTGSIGMTDDWLTGTPFRSWLLPGIALFLVVAVPMLTAAALEVRGHGLAPAATVLAGVLQVGWIAVQLLLMQRYFVLQPVVLVVAALILLVGGLRGSPPSASRP